MTWDATSHLLRQPYICLSEKKKSKSSIKWNSNLIFVSSLYTSTEILLTKTDRKKDRKKLLSHYLCISWRLFRILTFLSESAILSSFADIFFQLKSNQYLPACSIIQNQAFKKRIHKSLKMTQGGYKISPENSILHFDGTKSA